MPPLFNTLRITVLWIDRTTVAIGQCVAWLTAAMALTVGVIVITRNLFGMGAIALQESVTFMHAMVIMLAAAYALVQGAHVRVDIFYRRFQPLQKAWADMIGAVFFLLPVSLFIAIFSWEYVAASWAISERSADAGGLPGVFLLKGLVLINALLLTLQAIAELARNLLKLTFNNA